MRVLIVGGTSALGVALKPALSEFCEVLTAGRSNCDVQLDLSDPIEEMILPGNIDAVIHTAAHFGGKAPGEILEAEAVNVLGTLRLCQAAAQAGTRHFVLISSMVARLKENSEYYGIYALSKRHSEDVARLVCSTRSLPLAILRPSHIYGKGNTFRQPPPFFNMMIDKAKNGEDIVFYGSRDARRNFIYMDDLTAIIARVVQKQIVGTFSCQHPTDVTYSQVAKAAFAAFNKGGSVRFLSEHPDIADNVFEQDHSLYERIGFYPQTSIEEGLRRIAELS